MGRGSAQANAGCLSALDQRPRFYSPGAVCCWRLPSFPNLQGQRRARRSVERWVAFRWPRRNNLWPVFVRISDFRRDTGDLLHSSSEIRPGRRAAEVGNPGTVSGLTQPHVCGCLVGCVGPGRPVCFSPNRLLLGPARAVLPSRGCFAGRASPSQTARCILR